MALFSWRRKSAPVAYPPGWGPDEPLSGFDSAQGPWVYVSGAEQHEDAIGREEGDVTASLYALRSGLVTVWVDGKKVGYLPASQSALLAPLIRELAPQTRRIETEGRISTNDGGGFFWVIVRVPNDPEVRTFLYGSQTH